MSSNLAATRIGAECLRAPVPPSRLSVPKSLSLAIHPFWRTRNAAAAGEVSVVVAAEVHGHLRERSKCKSVQLTKEGGFPPIKMR